MIPVLRQVAVSWKRRESRGDNVLETCVGLLLRAYPLSGRSELHSHLHDCAVLVESTHRDVNVGVVGRVEGGEGQGGGDIRE